MEKLITLFFISFFYCLTPAAETLAPLSESSTIPWDSDAGALSPNATPPAPTTTATPANQPSASPAAINSKTPATVPTSQSSAKESAIHAHSKNTITIPPTTSIDIVINKNYLHSAKVQKLFKLLGVVGSPQMLHLVDDRALDLGLASKRNNIFIFQQRTFLSTLYYLRNAVEYTDEAVQQGLIDTVKYPNGQYYNLTEITKGLLRIHISNTMPQCNTNLKVYYRNHWFYIADNDIVSKKTIALLEQLYNLQAGDHSSQAPILTIPVR